MINSSFAANDITRDHSPVPQKKRALSVSSDDDADKTQFVSKGDRKTGLSICSDVKWMY